MREEDSNWFAKWEEELPSPEELIPLSQSLITPDLALAFDLRKRTSLAIFRSTGFTSRGCSPAEAAEETSSASRIISTHFLHPTARQSSDHFVPSFVPISSLQHHQLQFLHRQLSAVNFASQTNNNGKAMDQSLFLARQSQHQQQQVLTRQASLHLHSQVANYADALEQGANTVLTLFPPREN
ncbi:hypothetical protein F2Q70_00019942 [Brassica cretica]|uniref:Uncharacterized protein n=2 Tax=Brassica cretica TaxID=69181 RepID=A0A8S9S3B9_BRACR|nr:hypothetical protein F2Q68_00023331 [Brassica cretica]KAF2545195.1 hypothetical protein F2Q70_00019942 [Brassica cretica]KAF3587617.1 hypothetical protein F2Q69_00026715 [Brassica cretica]KAF3608619.1 hypothetical protein DY000_02045332 [Brassica cretica]